MFETGNTVILEDFYTGQMRTYRSKLIECGPSECAIDYPIDEYSKKRVMLENERELQVYIITKNKDVYRFSSKVIGRKYEQVPMLCLSFPGMANIRQVQRRKHVRVDNIINADVYSIDHEFPPFKTLTNDISAGGIAIVIPVTYELKLGRRLLLQIELEMRDGSRHALNVIGSERRIVQRNSEGRVLSLELDPLNTNDS